MTEVVHFTVFLVVIDNQRLGQRRGLSESGNRFPALDQVSVDGKNGHHQTSTEGLHSKYLLVLDMSMLVDLTGTL